MNDFLESELAIDSEDDIVLARRSVREFTDTLGFGITDVTRIVTTVSELTRNIYQYAGSGIMRWRRLDGEGRVGIELTFHDEGPGIPDPERVGEEGFTTGRGLGMGIPGSRRLMDEMEIDSGDGSGTIITVRKWRRV